MRELNVKEITAAVAKLCCDACYYLPQDLLENLKPPAIRKNRR